MSDAYKVEVKIRPAEDHDAQLDHIQAVMAVIKGRLDNPDAFQAVGILISAIMMLAASAPPAFRAAFAETVKESLVAGLEAQAVAQAAHEGSGEVRH